MSNDKVFEIVKSSLVELNQELEYESLRSIDNQTSIFGGEDGIDSLSLVRLIVQIERGIEKEYGEHIELSDSRAMSRSSSPYRDVLSLVEFVNERLRNCSA